MCLTLTFINTPRCPFGPRISDAVIPGNIVNGTLHLIIKSRLTKFCLGGEGGDNNSNTNKMTQLAGR